MGDPGLRVENAADAARVAPVRRVPPDGILFKIAFLALALTSIPPQGVAQSVRLLRDVDDRSEAWSSANTEFFLPLAERLVVVGGSSRARGIWGVHLDGRDPRLLVAIADPAGAQLARPLGTNGQFAVFSESDGHASRIWATNGTPQATNLLLDDGDSPRWQDLIPFGSEYAPGGRIVFRGFDPTWGEQLWSTSGAPGDFEQLTFVDAAGVDAAWRGPVVPFGGRLVLFRGLASNRFEVWITDGTISGTRKLDEIEGAQEPALAWAAGGRVYLSPRPGADNLRVGDGSSAGFSRVDLPEPGWNIRSAVSRGHAEVAFFIAWSAARGEELWRSDGTSAGTFVLTALAEPYPFLHSEYGFVALPHGVLFEAVEPAEVAGYWFAAADGSSLSRLPDLEPPAETFPPAESLALFPSSSGRALFLATSAATGRELWSSDGSAGGTFAVTELGVGAADGDFRAVLESSGRVVFLAGTTAAGVEVWASDAEGLSARPLSNFDRPEPFTRPRIPPFVSDDSVWVVASEDQELDHVWQCPLSGAGQERRTSFVRFAGTSEPLGFAGRDRRFFFEVCIDARIALWTSDGTSLGTHEEIFTGDSCLPGFRGSHWKQTLPDGGLALEWPSEGVEQIFRIDYSGGARQLTRFATGYLRGAFLRGEDLFYPRILAEGPELWRTDLLELESKRVAPLDEPGSARYTSSIVPVGGDGALVAYPSNGPGEIWWIDGGSGTVRPIGTQSLGIDVGSNWSPVALGDDLYFVARDDDGQGLYRYRPSIESFERLTPPGVLVDTTAYRPIVVDFDLAILGRDETGWRLGRFSPVDDSFHWIGLAGEPAAEWSDPSWASYRGRVLFAWRTAEAGAELWASDFTEVGTAQVADIEPGAFSSFPRAFVSSSKGVFFSAFDSASGFELWRSDGTAAGTSRVADLAPGASSSYPEPIVAFDDRLVLSAEREGLGREPWIVDFEVDPSSVFADDFECGGAWNWGSGSDL